MAKVEGTKVAVKKAEGKVAKLASREINGQVVRVYPCSADGTKMTWVRYYGNGRGRMALRCEKCGAMKFRSDL
ncbi:MAG: hypothetical protein L0191_02215 [Acidobacteria bacterium]|nr:hypothetical protein [Acidobacteriota bacterium]